MTLRYLQISYKVKIEYFKEYIIFFKLYFRVDLQKIQIYLAIITINLGF